MTDKEFENALIEVRPRLLHSSSRMMPKRLDAAEDAVQDALLLAWRFRRSFRGDSLFLTWMNRILRNCILSSYRRQDDKLVALGDYPVAEMQPIEERIDRKRQFEQVMIFVHDLPPAQHASVKIYLGTKKPTGYERLSYFRARHTLGEKMKQFEASKGMAR